MSRTDRHGILVRRVPFQPLRRVCQQSRSVPIARIDNLRRRQYPRGIAAENRDVELSPSQELLHERTASVGLLDKSDLSFEGGSVAHNALFAKAVGRILRHRLHNHRVAQAEPADPTRVQNLERRCGHPLRRKRLLCPGLVETQRENVTRSPGERDAQHLHCLREFPLGFRETIKTLKQVEDEVNLQRGEPHPRRRQRGFQADAQDLMSLPCQYKVDRFHRFEDRLHRQPFPASVVA